MAKAVIPMYDELIKRLRRWANSFCGCCKHADKKQKACDDCAAVYGSLWEAANAIEDLITALTASNEVIAKNKPKWISVTERLPEIGRKVLVCAYGHEILTARMNKQTENGYPVFECNGIFLEMAKPGRISHWMPLPQPPGSEG